MLLKSSLINYTVHFFSFTVPICSYTVTSKKSSQGYLGEKKSPKELRRISKWRDQRFPLSREAPFHLSYLSLIFSTHLLHLLFLAAFVFSSALDIPAVTSATRFLPLLFFPLCRIIGIMLSPPPPPPIMIFNISLPPRDLNVRH